MEKFVLGFEFFLSKLKLHPIKMVTSRFSEKRLHSDSQ